MAQVRPRIGEAEQAKLGWAALLFPASNQVIGALKASDRLHFERDAAVSEAAGWLNSEPIEWTQADERTWVGRPQSGLAVAVVRSVLLPKA
jgi:hypothetical protein